MDKLKLSEKGVGLCEEMVFSPSLKRSRLAEVERSCVGSELQTTYGAATWNILCSMSYPKVLASLRNYVPDKSVQIKSNQIYFLTQRNI